MSNPTVDILMATYNGERYVAEQIESIKRQTYQDWHLIISDDCSTDETLNIVQHYAAKDSRIQLVSKGIRYGGAKENFLSLIQDAASPYIMFCDQDDVWLPQKIELSLSRMNELEHHNMSVPLLVFTDMKVVDNSLVVISESFERYADINPNRIGFRQIIAQSIGAGCTMMFNQEAAKYAAQSTNIHDIIMHDWWLSLICSAFGTISYVDVPTSLYRQHYDNSVGAVKFKPLSWTGKVDEMAERQQSICRQASVFADTFGNTLSSRQMNYLLDCGASCSGSPIENLFHLMKSGAWKAGLRKLGQIAAVIRAGQ